jgi:hypothetical protein
MADNQTKSGALLSWAGGIAATVIAGVLIYHFTTPPAPPATPPPAQVGLNGFVEDDASQKPVVDAIVTADLGTTLASQPTDSEGRYAFIMDSTTPPAQSISIDVLAGGYEHYTATVPITSGNNFAGIQLQPTPVPAAAPQPGQPVAPVHLPPRPALIRRIPNNYKVRADTAALKPKQK